MVKIIFFDGKMRGIKRMFLLVLLSGAFWCSAQQPTHFILGQEELSGIDIYHVIQDKDYNYWLATNQGVIKFDGYTYTKIKSRNMLSSSVFDLKMDYNDNIYCKNLSGQIFQVKDHALELKFQVPDSLMHSEVYYDFNKKNEMVFITKTIFKVDNNNKIVLFRPLSPATSFAQPIKLKDSSIMVHDFINHKLHFIKADSMETHFTKEQTDQMVIHAIYFNDQLTYYDRKTGKLVDRIGNTFSINPHFNPVNGKNEYLRFYTDNQNLWIARYGGGIKVFDNNLSPLFNNNTIFKNSIISSFLKDKEGNIILGTFGEGLIVVTNLVLTEINLPDPNAKITRITSSSDNSIFLGTQNGKIYRIDSTLQISLFRDKQFKNIEVLEYIEETNELIVNDRTPAFINLTTGTVKHKQFGAIKDIVQLKENSYLVASNIGLYAYALDNQTPDFTLLNNFRGRTNCVGYNPNTASIYAGTALGLKIGNEERFSYFTLNNKPVISRCILYADGKIYIATKNDGVLIFEGDTLVDQWMGKNNAYEGSIRFIKQYQGKLFLSTSSGIQILNKKGEVLNSLSTSGGLYSNNIIDFEIKQDVLWLVHQKGVQPINIQNIKPFEFKPSITLSQLRVNDTIRSIAKNSTFSYDQNKFEFIVSAKNIRFSNEIEYHYQLYGIDKEWQVNNYYENKMIYKSLPPGSYVFKIKSVFRTNESKLLTYSFTISHPFWNTWWFYGFLISTFITIVLMVFKVQLEKQRKKNQLKNELNASKLIAIQSQMNPHFIFNSINSIQDLILKGDIDNSYSYIIKFAKLVRQTLNFSDKEFIDIEEEIELLEIYLELEKLRFKDDFEYSINNEESDIQVPPMLVQPFVENAIKHGLLHQDGIKKLDITFKKNEVLHCTIVDNGIGRKKAQEIKERQQKNHQSFSVNATESRFEIMKSQYQQELGIKYIDLYEGKKGVGTKVIINMPFKTNY